jgi:hypothetical protein
MRIKALVVLACAISAWGCTKRSGDAGAAPRLEGGLLIVETPDDDVAMKVVREPSTGVCWMVATGYRTLAIHPSPCPSAEER